MENKSIQEKKFTKLGKEFKLKIDEYFSNFWQAIFIDGAFRRNRQTDRYTFGRRRNT